MNENMIVTFIGTWSKLNDNRVSPFKYDRQGHLEVYQCFNGTSFL